MGLLGCGSPAVGRLFGEVHVHQFPGGVHPAALFLREAVDARLVSYDSVLPSAENVARSDGACRLIVPGLCAPPCGVDPAVVNDGNVRIDGGRGVPSVTMTWQGSTLYVPSPPLPPGASIFEGGETLEISADGARAFSVAIRAPLPVVLTAPATLSAPPDGLTVSWIPDRATRMQLSLVASAGNSYALVRCEAADELGRFAIPASMMSALPPPPRDLELEASRDELVRAPSRADGQGVQLHAAYAVQLEAHEN
jgi:hypothetical protein